MCQLLGMNCHLPTDIGFSFRGFRARGGRTDHHTDGFGVAFFERSGAGKLGLRCFHDDRPSDGSPIAATLGEYPIYALNVIAHIRRATQGVLGIENTHPFVREVWGEPWVFAHNGQMTREFIAKIHRLQKNGNGEFYHPIGDTDSELAFCYLLNRVRTHFRQKPDDEALFDFLTAQCRYLASSGLFNCLISNGRWQLAYAGSLLFYLTRRPPFGCAMLCDDDVKIDFAPLTKPDDVITIIATLPLTLDEKWTQLCVDECAVFKDGARVYQNLPDNPRVMSVEDGIALARRVGASA